MELAIKIEVIIHFSLQGKWINSFNLNVFKGYIHLYENS